MSARDRARTRRELEALAKQKARAKLAQLREIVAARRADRRQRMREVTHQCKEQRDRNRERARQAREALRDAYAELRLLARQQCARAKARAADASDLEAAEKALREEREAQALLRRWSSPTRAGAKSKRQVARELQQESDEEVLGNLDDPTLIAAFREVKRKIKGSPRRSRTEAFLEWAAENKAEVWAAAERDAARHLEELEREERELAKQLKKSRPYRDVSDAELEELANYGPLSAVPF